jgi:hypothetical protein
MSKVQLSGDPAGSGTITLAAPNTNSNVTLTLPTASGTINTSGSVNEVPAGTVSAPSIYPTGDTNTGIFFPAADTIAFSEGGVESMRIDSAGNVGVGVTNPAQKLEVAGGVYIKSGGAISNLFYDSALVFDQGGVGERARIDSSGNLLVGTATVIGVGRLSINFGASGDGIALSCSTSGDRTQIAFNNSNGGVGRIATSGSSTSYVTSSDYRLKENIAPMTGALEKVAALKPCTYTWKADSSAGQGFIAHELQAVVPDCVTGEKDAVETVDEIDAEGRKIGTKEVPRYQGVDTSFLVATLTAAIQEQQALIQDLTARLEAVENK